jgi:hypothetical protein
MVQLGALPTWVWPVRFRRVFRPFPLGLGLPGSSLVKVQFSADPQLGGSAQSDSDSVRPAPAQLGPSRANRVGVGAEHTNAADQHGTGPTRAGQEQGRPSPSVGGTRYGLH